MPVFLLGFLGFGKTLFQGAVAWLSKRSLAEIICLALGLALAVDHIALLASHRHAAKVQTQLAKCAEAQKHLAAQSKIITQQVTKTVDHYITVTKPEVQTIVQKIESAPLPGNCKTPKEVLNADV